MAADAAAVEDGDAHLRRQQLELVGVEIDFQPENGDLGVGAVAGPPPEAALPPGPDFHRQDRLPLHDQGGWPVDAVADAEQQQSKD